MTRIPRSTAQLRHRIRRYGLPLGTNTASGNDAHLEFERLTCHVHVIGPPGRGKTRVLFGMFESLCAFPKATIIMMNPKGALCRMARDWMVERSMAKRLVWFEPGGVCSIGYNPMQPNGMAIETHAKVVREGIAAARGQHSFDETPQLSRMLFLCLATARTFGLGLWEALEILRPGSRLRKILLPQIRNPFIKQSLAYLDSLSLARQDELVSSSLARLESFVGDPINLRMLTHTPSMKISDVIENHQVLLVNLEIGQPLVADDVKLWGRFIVNDILNCVRRRPAGSDITPVYLICDEVQFFATRDLCDSLATGRELGLHLIAAHQELSQLRDEDKGGDLYHSIMGCARTKLLFGGISVEDLKVLAPEVMIDQYSPTIIKDEILSLEIEPVESTREVITRGPTEGEDASLSVGKSAAIGRGRTYGESHQWGSSLSHSDGLSLMHSTAANTGVSAGETILPGGGSIVTANGISGNTEADMSGSTMSDSYADFQSTGTQDSVSTSEVAGKQVTIGKSVNRATSESRSTIPFVESHVRRVPSGRAFISPEEFDRMSIAAIKNQPDRHFVVKTDDHPAVFCQALFVPDPVLSQAKREEAMQEIFRQEIYAKPVPAVAESTAPPSLIAASHQEAAMLEFSDAPPIEFLEKKKK